MAKEKKNWIKGAIKHPGVGTGAEGGLVSWMTGLRPDPASPPATHRGLIAACMISAFLLASESRSSTFRLL